MAAARTQPTSDTCALGHVEVVGAYTARGVITLTDGTSVTVRQGMSKFDLKRIFDTSKTLLNTASNNVTNNANYTGGVNDGADYNTRAQIFGNIEISGSSDRLLLPMIALDSGANGHTAGVTTHVIDNTDFDVAVGAETNIGSGFANTVSGDNLNDIEGALVASNVSEVYTSGSESTFFEITFPTKYRHIISGRYSGNGAVYEAPFHTDGSVQYGLSLFDNQENSAPVEVTSLCIVSPCTVSTTPGEFLIHEVNYEMISGSSTWNPESGWFNFALSANGGTDSQGYTWPVSEGVPTIGYAHYYNSTGSVTAPLTR
ncbi:hypothetical protein JCM17961_17640 [Endothiovibrio diazotrophicus]